MMNAQDSNTMSQAAPTPIEHDVDHLLINIDGYEGPMDVLLDLARNQKVDLATISILHLVRQYLAFIERAKNQNLQLAAEYLVMAAWLAYLKSRMFLPKEDTPDEPSAEDMAQALQFQLRRLESVQNAAEKLQERPQLGQDVFARGRPEGLDVNITTQWNVSLYDVIKAYGAIKTRKEDKHYDLPAFQLMSTENAMGRLREMLGALPRKGVHSVWTTLQSFMPDEIEDRLYARSTLASTFTAGLELAKQGRVELRQDGLFRPVYLRAKEGNEAKEVAS